MFGLTGVLIALVVLTIILAGVFLARPSFTTEVTGKILAFLGLCVLPTLCISAGMSFHMQRSEQTAYCVSCHSMETHGQSLYVLNASYIPAQHFQNHLVPPNQACYTCHTDYTMYGPLKDKLKGLHYLYMEYVSTPPKIIHLEGTYSNMQCLHCHAGMRTFDENPTHTAIMGSLKTNQISCISCHNTIHNASEVGQLKMWVDGDVPASPAAASSSAAPVNAKLTATAGPAKVSGGSSAGKAVFDSQGCGGCHGDAGTGASGPALTHISSQYPPAKLTAVLTAPTAGMKAAGMVPLTLDAADMKSLVSYVSSLGGTSAPAAAKPPAAGSPSSSPAKPEPVAAAAPSKASTGNSASDATAAGGKAIFDSQHCSSCHGDAGVGGSGPALTRISSQYPPAKLSAVLATPTAGMKAAGMVPLTLDAADMKSLVSYVSTLGETSASAAPASPSAETSSATPAKPEPAAAAASSKAPAESSGDKATDAEGKAIFDSHGCSGCHGVTGGGGSGPALAHGSSHYSPAQVAAVQKGLTVVLKAPTADMKAAGMVPLTLNDGDMNALVSYVSSLGEASAPAATTLPASGSASLATAATPKASAASSAENATAAGGKAIFDSHGCSGCHGDGGGGGSAPALTHTSSQYPPAKLTAVLTAPTAGMKAAGMVPLTLDGADMKSLVSYVSSLGGTSNTSPAASPAAESSPTAPAAAKQALPTAPSNPKKKGTLGWLFVP